MKTIVYLNGHLIDSYGDAKPVEAGSTIYVDRQNTMGSSLEHVPLTVTEVDVLDNVQVITTVLKEENAG